MTDTSHASVERLIASQLRALSEECQQTCGDDPTCVPLCPMVAYVEAMVRALLAERDAAVQETARFRAALRDLKIRRSRRRHEPRNLRAR